MPYVQGTSEIIKRILKDADIRVAFKPIKTLNHCFPRPKDPIKSEEKCGIVYQIPCNDCKFVYIGQTQRRLSTRIHEHKRAVRNMDVQKSAICEHILQTDHKVNWNGSKVLKYITDYNARLFSESWFINKHPNVINRNDGAMFPASYSSLLSLN